MLSLDRGVRADALLGLQQASGNRAVAQLVHAYAGGGNAPQVSLHGKTYGSYDGGTSTVLEPKVAKARGCDCPADEPCLRASGKLRVTYKVDVTIEMPEVPEGLTPARRAASGPSCALSSARTSGSMPAGYGPTTVRRPGRSR